MQDLLFEIPKISSIKSKDSSFITEDSSVHAKNLLPNQQSRSYIKLLNMFAQNS